jgi:integrase
MHIDEFVLSNELSIRFGFFLAVLLIMALWQSSEWFVFGKDENPALLTRPGTIGQRLNHHLRKTRMAKVTCHDLRHASASALLASGWSIADVAARLRETIETCSKTYVHSLATSHDNDALRNALGL